MKLTDGISTKLTVNLKNGISRDELLADLIKKKRFALGLVDSSYFDNPEAAFLNGNYMMYAASLPKIAVLMTAMKAIEDGELPESPDVIHDMYDMISKSDNEATTIIIDKISLEKIERIVTFSK